MSARSHKYGIYPGRVFFYFYFIYITFLVLSIFTERTRRHRRRRVRINIVDSARQTRARSTFLNEKYNKI